MSRRRDARRFRSGYRLKEFGCTAAPINVGRKRYFLRAQARWPSAEGSYFGWLDVKMVVSSACYKDLGVRMRLELQKAVSLVKGVENPFPAFLDRLGLRGSPYVLRMHDGTLIKLRPKSGDFFGFFEIMLRRDYLIAGQRLQAGDTVIDIGANIGCFSIQAAKIVGPSGMVIAVEPDKSTFDQLLENIKINKLTNVMPIRSAVGGAQGSITLRSSPNRLFSSVFASVNGHDVEGEQQEVDLTTLENLMQAYKVARCDYLKLDCEGAEHDIVGAMSKATATKVLQITMEVHKVPDRDGQVLVDRLRMLGYERLGASTLPYYAQRSVVASPGASLTV